MLRNTCTDMYLLQVISGSYDTTVRVWQLGTGAGLQTLRGHTGPVLALRAADSQLVTGGADRCVRVWDLDTGYCSGTLEGHGDAVTCLTVDWDKQQVISGSLDRTIKVCPPSCSTTAALVCDQLNDCCTAGVEYRLPVLHQHAGLDLQRGPHRRDPLSAG